MYIRLGIGRIVRRHVVTVRTLVTVVSLTILLVSLGGLVVTITDPGEFDGLFEGWWWAAATITTVGYGDIVPVSTAGRITGILLMFLGVAMLAIMTASIAALLMSEDVEEEERHLEHRIDELQRSITEALAVLAQSPPARLR